MSKFNEHMLEHAEKCPVCDSANISGSSETGIACDNCGYEE